MEAMDNADIKNMDNLEKVGEGLLTQKVKRINLSSYKPFELDQT